MKRVDFYKKTTADTPEGDTTELDFLDNALSEISLTYRTSYYRVGGQDDMRPWNISHKVYGTTDFWWVILLVNDIENPFTDIEIGAVLNIPNILDIQNFQKKFRVRRTIG